MAKDFNVRGLSPAVFNRVSSKQQSTRCKCNIRIFVNKDSSHDCGFRTALHHKRASRVLTSRTVLKLLNYREQSKDGSFDFEETGRVVLGDIRGTRKRCLGMAGKLLTDARETSYWI